MEDELFDVDAVRYERETLETNIAFRSVRASPSILPTYELGI
jgi:hypothetical protein